MTTEPKDTAVWYLRMFSYLLILCGLFGLATGAVVLYQAVADGGVDEIVLSLGSVALGLSLMAANAITLAAGLLGRATSRNPRRAPSLFTVALAGIAATLLGLGLCSATGAGMPTSLLFNGLIMIIGAVIAHNLRNGAE